MSDDEPGLQPAPLAYDLSIGRGDAPFALAERAAKIGYWRYDFATNRKTWSKGMYAQLGLEPGDDTTFENEHLRDISRRAVKEACHIIESAIAAKEPFHFRSRMTTKDGQERIFETHGEIEFGPDDKPLSVIGVRHDITDLVAAETARRQAEAMYRNLAEQATDIIVLYNAQMEPVYVSPAYQRLLGRPRLEARWNDYHANLHPDDICEAERLERVPGPGETQIGAFRVRHNDGHYVWLESSIRAIYDDAGALQNIICVVRDITDRKRQEFEIAAARDRAEAANLAKSTFLANMSHELRTPLNAIIGFADMMRQQMFGPLGAPRYEEYTKLIHDSGALLLDLISDVLDMAKIEAGKLELHVEELDVNCLVHDSVRILEDRAAQAGVTLETELGASALPIEADRRALKQILLNLLSNAVKFTPAGGTIRVSASQRDGAVVLAVSDDGIGIPAKDLPRLGQPFEQVSNDPTISKGGTGLGLALVHALAAKHGGRARIESEEGIGTTVTVEMPCTQDARAAA